MNEVATFASFILYTLTPLKTQKSIKVSTFSFNFQPTLCQTLESIFQNNIYKLSLYSAIYNDFFKIFDMVGSFKKKCGNLDLLYRRNAKVGVIVATFQMGLLPCT